MERTAALRLILERAIELRARARAERFGMLDYLLGMVVLEADSQLDQRGLELFEPR